MIKRFFYLFSFLLVLISFQLVSCNDVKSNIIEETNKNENTIASDDSLLIWAINLNSKYVLTEWWNGPKSVAFGPSLLLNSKPLTTEQQSEIDKSIESFSNWNNQDFLFIPNWQKNDYSEQAILPSCYACRIISSAIYYGIYDAEVTIYASYPSEA